MDNISEKEFDKAIPLEVHKNKSMELTEEQFTDLLKQMENPVKAQQEIAVKIKTFLDNRIEVEMADKGVLSDHTRRWTVLYTDLLEKMQRALYGDRSVNLHIHNISHADIATKVREANKNVNS